VSLRAAGTVFETVEPFPGSVRRIDG